MLAIRLDDFGLFSLRSLDAAKRTAMHIAKAGIGYDR